jgi:hypothetical protein
MQSHSGRTRSLNRARRTCATGGWTRTDRREEVDFVHSIGSVVEHSRIPSIYQQQYPRHHVGAYHPKYPTQTRSPNGLSPPDRSPGDRQPANSPQEPRTPSSNGHRGQGFRKDLLEGQLLKQGEDAGHPALEGAKEVEWVVLPEGKVLMPGLVE